MVEVGIGARCPACGTDLSQEGLSEGLCPVCLIELALNDPSLEAETQVESGVASNRSLDGETMSLWKLYLLAVASLGLYLPFWVYRRAKLNGEGAEFSSTPAWWGFGTFVTPVCCAILYDFSGKAMAVSGRWRGLLWRTLPSILFAVIVLVAFLTANVTPLVALFFLLPIPFLVVQHRINGSYSGWKELATIRPFRLAVRHWILLILGLPVVLALWWFVDIPSYSTLTTRRMAEKVVVTGSSGSYELTIPSGSWKRVKAGTLVGDDTDLELLGPGISTWLVVYLSEEPMIGIEEVVVARRDAVLASGEPVKLFEERFFLEGSELVPVSLARYRIDLMGLEEYIVLTAELDSGPIEVLGYTAEPFTHSEELHDLVASFSEAEVEGGR